RDRGESPMPRSAADDFGWHPAPEKRVVRLLGLNAYNMRTLCTPAAAASSARFAARPACPMSCYWSGSTQRRAKFRNIVRRCGAFTYSIGAPGFEPGTFRSQSPLASAHESQRAVFGGFIARGRSLGLACVALLSALPHDGESTGPTGAA